MSNLIDKYLEVQYSLVRMAAPLADEAREMINKAMLDGNAETVRKEGHSWSGCIGLVLLQLADAIDQEGPVKELPRGF